MGGYSKELFIDQAQLEQDDLLCLICHDVLKDPTMLNSCDHVFCKVCIDNWRRTGKNTCPADRTQISGTKKAPRLYKTLLDRLQMRCAFSGCVTIFKLEEFEAHVKECGHNPDTASECAGGCGAILTKNQRQGHNCVLQLKRKLEATNQELEHEKKKVQKITRENEDLKEKVKNSGAGVAQASSSSSAASRNANANANSKPVCIRKVMIPDLEYRRLVQITSNVTWIFMLENHGPLNPQKCGELAVEIEKSLLWSSSPGGRTRWRATVVTDPPAITMKRKTIRPTIRMMELCVHDLYILVSYE